jgi:proteasome lid subunit RPN8/RPN11
LQKIILSESDKKILTKHAENEKPNESCAILFGKDNLVSEVFLTKNIEESPVNFTISNDQLIEGYKIAEDKKLQVIGIFHSHPNSEAYP